MISATPTDHHDFPVEAISDDVNPVKLSRTATSQTVSSTYTFVAILPIYTYVVRMKLRLIESEVSECGKAF